MAEKINKEITALLSLKIKPRQDGYSDQVCRIFMCKVMLVGAVITGLSWWTEKIHCIIPKYGGDKDSVMDADFVSAACWINGMYIYEDIRYHSNSLGYYGIPNDVSLDGIFPSGTTCSTKKHEASCKPMKKTFFLQYQYMTFFLMGLAVLFYAPYCLFKLVNTDLNSLKASLKAGESAEEIVSTYFNKDISLPYNRTGRIFGNIVVKILYVVVSVIAFLVMNGAMNGEYVSYGTNWLKWSALNNTMAYDYMGHRHSPKPGDVLFPSYAFCEVYEAAKDVRIQMTNKHKFVCEMSQHIIYQYIFIIIWFATVMTIVVSIIGLGYTLLDHVLSQVTTGHISASGNVRKKFSLWEIRYLELIRRKKLDVYGDVLRLLLETRTRSATDKNDLKLREVNNYNPLSNE